MAHEPKLEVFILELKPIKDEPNDFLSFFEQKLNTSIDHTLEADRQCLFLDVFKDLIQTIDKPEFIKNEKKGKGFTAYDTSEDVENSSITPMSERHIIHGFLTGGPYGRMKTIANFQDKSTTSDVSKDDVIADSFYFLLYTPLGSRKAILMIQCYSGDTIADILKEFFQEYLSIKNKYRRPTINRFFPESIIERFESASVISAVCFRKDMLLEFPTTGSNPIHRDYGIFKVKVELVPKNPIGQDKLDEYMADVDNQTFLGVALEEFNKTGTLKNSNTNRQTKFEIKPNFDISPQIYLTDHITVDPNTGNFDHSELKSFCLDLLQEVKMEVYPEYNVQDI